MKIIQRRKIWIGISLILIIIGFVFMGVNAAQGKGAFNYDIQFTGGTSIEVNIGKDFDQDELEELVAGVVENDQPSIQKVTSENKAIIKLQSVIDDITVNDALEDATTAEETDAVENSDETDIESEEISADEEADAAAEAEEAEADAAEDNADEDAAAEDNANEDSAEADDTADTADDSKDGNVLELNEDNLIDNGDGTYSIDPGAFENMTDENGNQLVQIENGEGSSEAETASEETTEHVFKLATGEGYSGNIADVIAAVAEKYQLEDADFSVTQISATISSEMTRDAIIAVFLACLMMLIYVSIRFKDFRTGAASIIALIHDALIVLACYAVLRIPLSSSFIAAILTVLGYSINASIVIFDRVRENKSSHRKWDAEQLVDESVHQCMRRSLFTSLTTLLTIGSLYVFGVQSIKEFALPIVVGIIAGTWSSVLIAGSVWFELSKIKFKKS